jgi:enoyl-CoA hydratase
MTTENGQAGLEPAAHRGRPDYARYEELLIKRDAGIALVTMNRPEAYNAMTYRMHYELSVIWDDLEADPEVMVVVLTGAGRAFSAGNDLKQPDPSPEKAAEIMAEARSIARGMVNMSKPIVAAINGVAVGGGAQLAFMSDITVTGKDVKLFDGHISAGAVAGDHACLIWPLLCGMAKAKYHLFTDTPITGEEAERIGLVSLAVERDEVLDKALEIAHSLTKKSQPALRGTKRGLNGWLELAWPVLELSLALELLDFGGPDVTEARAAFKEKRQPDFPSARV